VDESDDEGPAVKKLAPGTWGVTLILAPVSLLGQWMDELKQFAPQLKVANVHGSGKARVDAIAGADVLLCAATSGQGALNGSPASRRPIHRMIIDEAHTLSRGFSSAAAGQLFRIGARHVWLLTGTPLTTSVQELRTGAALLGQYEAGLRLCENGVGPALVAKLKQLMIRHTKSMRIGGELALALPESDVSTVWLTMNATERRVYDKAKAAVVKQFRLEASQAVSIDMKLSRLRATCANAYGKASASAGGTWPSRCQWDDKLPYSQADLLALCTYIDHPPTSRGVTQPNFWTERSHREYHSDPAKCTKLGALRADLLALRKTEPSLHAVVFTHVLAAHVSICAMLKKAGFAVLEFTGSTTIPKRHAAIREFQSSQGGRQAAAKVFVITMKTGSVGITLTAATRVYLMEPCLDPAMEVQAAGRIHRLGQTKDVLVKRYAFRDSLEENIVKLHAAMRAARNPIRLTDGVFPCEAVRMLVHGPAGGGKGKGKGKARA